MRTVLLTLTYGTDIDHSTVEALVDAHSNDEGLVAISCMQVTAPYVRLLADDEGDEVNPAVDAVRCSLPGEHDPHQYEFADANGTRWVQCLGEDDTDPYDVPGGDE
jgi:hypothetical protein